MFEGLSNYRIFAFTLPAAPNTIEIWTTFWRNADAFRPTIGNFRVNDLSNAADTMVHIEDNTCYGYSSNHWSWIEGYVFDPSKTKLYLGLSLGNSAGYNWICVFATSYPTDLTLPRIKFNVANDPTIGNKMCH